MSVQALSAAFGLKIKSPTVKLVLLALANHADPENRCWPSQKTLSKLTSLSERSIRNALDRLEQDGIISRTDRRRPNGSRTTDLIDLVFAQPAHTAGSEQAASVAGSQPAPPAPPPAPRAAPTTFEPSLEPRERKAKNLSLSPAASRRASARPKSEIPDGYPDAAAIAEAKERIAAAGVRLDAALQAETFRNHATGNGRRLVEWPPAWANWIIDAIAKAPKAPQAKPAAPAVNWTGPPEHRARVVMEAGEPFALNYLDPSEWTEDGIIPRNAYAAKKLGPLKALRGIEILPPKAQAA